MFMYHYGNKLYTEDEIDQYIAIKKTKARERFVKYYTAHPDKPIMNDLDEPCPDAQYVDDGGGWGIWDPETEQQFDERMAGWKDRIKIDWASDESNV